MYKIKAFNDWCRLICVVSIVSGVLMALLPGSKLDSAFKGLVSLVLISCFILPVDGKTVSFSIDEITAATDSEKEYFVDSGTVVIDCAESLLEDTLNSELKKISPDIYCKTSIVYTDETAYIEKIEVYGCGDEYERENAITVIADSTGGDTEIEFR